MIRKDIKKFLSTIPNHVIVVAATKYACANDMRVLFENGVNYFGENRVDAFLEKYEQLKDIRPHWHFIGHLQRNKALEVIDKIECLHSLDSLKLAELINKSRNAPLDCFVEVSINLEENKNGVNYCEAKSFVQQVMKYPKIHLVGLMMMAVAHSDEKSLNKQFSKLNELRNSIEKDLNISLPCLSMGMSDDYLCAIKNGATHVRLGRILFKE